MVAASKTWMIAEQFDRQFPTERQAETLASILQLEEELGRTPSLREIGARLGITLNAVRNHLMALRRRGLVTWTANAGRSLVVNRTIPILGECT